MRSNKALAAEVVMAAALVAAPAGAQPTGAIEVGTLSELDAWGVGAVQGGFAPLPRTLWRGSDATALGLVFDRLPQSLGSPAGERLARQAILSPGQAPLGDAANAARKRFQAIARMGLAEPLITMTAGARDAKADPAIAVSTAQAELALGRTSDACRRVNAIDPLGAPSVLVPQMRAFCLALAGETDAAALAIELAKAANAGDPWLQSAIGILGGSLPAKPLNAKYDTALTATASFAARLTPPARATLQSANALALLTVAGHEQAPAPLRASAALRALRDGVLKPDAARAALRGVYGQPGAPGLSQAVVEAENATSAYARAFAIEGALRGAASQADFAAAAALFAADRAALTPDRGLAGGAPLFVRAALTEGDYLAAQTWRDQVDPTATDPSLLGILDLCLALWRRDDAQSQAAAQRRIDTAAPRTARLVARDLKAVATLGANIGSGPAAFVANTPPAPGRKADAASIAQLTLAAQQYAVGETALLAALILGDGAEKLDAGVLAAVVEALRSVGLEAQARLVVVEAVIGGQARTVKP